MQNAQIHLQRGPEDYPAPVAATVRAANGAAPFPPAPGSIHSILIMKLDALGDHLLATPFFAGLRGHYPHAKITLLCVKENLNLAETNPAFDHIVPLPHPAGSDERLNAVFAIELQSHAAAPFDMVIVPRWGEDWHHAGVIAKILDAPYRITYSARSTPFKLRHALHHENFYTHLIDAPGTHHEVWRGLQLLHALGAELPPVDDIRLELHTTPADEEKINLFLQDKNYPRPWFAFGVGASLDHKRWPAEKFAELAQALEKKYGGTIFITGHGEKDAAAAATISAKRKDCVNCIGNLTPRETGSLVARCDIIITNDSFVLHAAAAKNVPVVEIIGHPRDGSGDNEYLPFRFGPWGPSFAWVQPA